MIRRWFLICTILFTTGLICGCGTESSSTVRADKTETIDKDMYVFWGLLGSYPEKMHLNPYHLTRDDKTVNSGLLLYSIRRTYKSPQTISEETDIPIDDVKSKLDELLSCELVRESNGRFLVNFPFWDEPLRDEIVKLGQKITSEVIERITDNLPTLEQKYLESSLPEQGYVWKDVSLTIIGGLLLDTGLNDRGLRKWSVFQQSKHTPERPGGYRYWYRAVEGGWGKFWKFGHNMSFDNDNNIGMGFFYGQLKGGNKINWDLVWDFDSEEKRKVIFSIIKHTNIKKTDLLNETGLSKDDLLAMLEEMEELKVISIENDLISANFPVFRQHDVDIFLVEIDRICDDIIEDVYHNFIPEIKSVWQKIKPEHWDIPYIDDFFIREVFSRPYNFVLDILIRDGILPESPVEPPFNYWGLNGKFDVL